MNENYIEILADMFWKHKLYSNDIGMQEFLDEYKAKVEKEEPSTETQLEGAVVEVPEQAGTKGRGRPRKEVRV